MSFERILLLIKLKRDLRFDHDESILRRIGFKTVVLILTWSNHFRFVLVFILSKILQLIINSVAFIIFSNVFAVWEPLCSNNFIVCIIIQRIEPVADSWPLILVVEKNDLHSDYVDFKSSFVSAFSIVKLLQTLWSKLVIQYFVWKWNLILYYFTVYLVFAHLCPLNILTKLVALIWFLLRIMLI